MKRSLRTIGLVAAGMLIGAALVGIQLLAQAPPGGPAPGGAGRAGGGGGGFRMMGMGRFAEQALSGSWAFVSFGMNVEDGKLVELRPIYKKAWEEGQALAKEMEGIQPDQMREKMQALTPKMQESQKQLLESVKAKLTPEQSEKLVKWYEEQAAQAQRQFSGAPGGAGGGGRAGGGAGGNGGGGRPNR